jgi:CheY-like chemotaxis protein
MIDVTTHRQLEAQLQHAQKMEAIGRLAGGIAHDFNNLLTAIEGYADMLAQRTDGNPDAAQDIAEIQRAVARAAALTRQLLAFSRRQVVRPRPTRLDTVVRDVESMLRRLITEDVPLLTRIHGECWVNIDPGQLEQVIVNLVLNARDANPVHGIEIMTSRSQIDETAARGLQPGEYAVIDVSDDGVGISADVLPFIFEPFFTTKPVGKGTGLGLATVYGIVQDCGGHVFVESEPGHGTRAEVFLPLLPGRPSTTAPPATGARPVTGSERILLVEDEAAVRSLAERVLIRNGYDVLTAQNGIDALQFVNAGAGPFDLLITDVVMPGMGGVQLARVLLEKRPDLRVLFISGHAADTLPELDSRGRATRFLEKPFSPNMLAGAVRDILDEHISAATN